MQQTNSLLGLVLVLIGAFMAAGYMLIGRELSGKIDTVCYTAIIYSIAALFQVLIVIFRSDEFFAYSNRVWGLFITLAIVPQFLGHSLLNYSLQTLPATTVSIALLGEPVGSTILAMHFLKEMPSILHWVSGIVIMIEIVYSVLPSRKCLSEV